MADDSAIETLQQLYARGGGPEESRGSRAAPDPYAFLPYEQVAYLAGRGDPRARMQLSIRQLARMSPGGARQFNSYRDAAHVTQSRLNPASAGDREIQRTEDTAGVAAQNDPRLD